MMLSSLEKLPFALIWPGNWDDLGFTEREIWINNMGYGYIMCDEPTQRWKGQGLGKEKWIDVKAKILDESLTYHDIQGTSLEDMLNAIYLDYCDFDDQEQLCRDLSDLASTDFPEGYFYAMETLDGTLYFDSEDDFKAAFVRDWADEYWETMNDELLAEWIERLSVIDDDPALVEWAKKYTLAPNGEIR